MADKSTSPYSANHGEIASPNDNSVITSLNRGEKNSMPVRHNEHIGSFNSKGSQINSPANDIIITDAAHEIKNKL